MEVFWFLNLKREKKFGKNTHAHTQHSVKLTQINNNQNWLILNQFQKIKKNSNFSLSNFQLIWLRKSNNNSSTICFVFVGWTYSQFKYRKDGRERGYLFQEVDGVLQVHTKIDKGPLDTFTFVLFLLKNEHVVVEELLQFLVGEIDAKLLETVVLRFFFVSGVRSHKGKKGWRKI